MVEQHLSGGMVFISNSIKIHLLIKKLLSTERDRIQTCRIGTFASEIRKQNENWHCKKGKVAYLEFLGVVSQDLGSQQWE